MCKTKKMSTSRRRSFAMVQTDIQTDGHMGGLVMMVISKKNWEFLPNTISTM